LQRPLACPGDVGGEVGVSPGPKALGDDRIDLRAFAGEHEELLGMAANRIVEPALHLVRAVEVRAVGGEGAVLAVAAAGSRQGQRVVAREGDAPHAVKLARQGPRSQSLVERAFGGNAPAASGSVTPAMTNR